VRTGKGVLGGKREGRRDRQQNLLMVVQFDLRASNLLPVSLLSVVSTAEFDEVSLLVNDSGLYALASESA
jgi:hypothetical protein